MFCKIEEVRKMQIRRAARIARMNADDGTPKRGNQVAARKKSGVKKRDLQKAVDLLTEMLSYLLPAQQAEPIARKLFAKFGSLAGIVNARESDIAKMGEGLEAVAAYLKTFQKASIYYLEDKNSEIQRVYDSKSAFELLKPGFVNRRTEAVVLLLLDGRSRVLYNDIINEGSVSEVPIYVRKIVELCLSYNAYDAILAHNHPSGNPLPSANDLTATQDIEIALNSIDVTLTDHIIIAGADYLSLKSSEWLDRIKKQVQEYRENLRQKSWEEEAALEIWHPNPSAPQKKRCADKGGE